MTTVITSAKKDTPALGGLFAGLSFFLVQRVPSRSHYVTQIQANGGRVVKLEAQADYVIADDLRKDAPSGSISYKFIDASIRNGDLADHKDHSAGPPQGAIRAVGSLRPAKGTRTPFTDEEDRELWDWVEQCRENGLSVKGNEIYKEMEAQHPRHPFQAWRDRYIKKLLGRQRPVVEAKKAATEKKKRSKLEIVDGRATFYSQADFDCIMAGAEAINCLDVEQSSAAWEAWAKGNTEHSADEWKHLWDNNVKPAYLRRLNGDESEEDEPPTNSKRKRATADQEQTAEHESKRCKLISIEEKGPSGVLRQPHVASSERNSLDQGEIIQEGVLETANGVHGDQLTEANLASQQAQHRGQLLRATDLVPDGEQNDQSAYIKYLQHTMNGAAAANGNNNESNLPPDPLMAQNPNAHDFFDQFVVGPSDLNGITTADQQNTGDPFEWDPEPQNQTEIESDGVVGLPFDVNGDYSAFTAGQKLEYDRIFSSQPFRSQGFEVSRYPEQSLEPTPHEDDRDENSGDVTPRANGHRQGEYEAETQKDIDLTLAEPEGGFGLSSQTEHAVDDEASNRETTPTGVVEISSASPSSSSLPGSSLQSLPATSRQLTTRQPKAIETQDILDAETQIPDFDMPLPLDPELNSLPSDPELDWPPPSDSLDEEMNQPLPVKKQKPPTKKTADPAPDVEDVEAFMDRMKVRLGYDDDAVIDALEHTSMRPQLAELVLLYQKTGKDMPADVCIRGVWADEEDRMLESGDARGLRKLTERFGWPECEARLKFLEQWRES